MHPRFPAYLRQALHRAGMSQRAFGLLVGYAQANVQQIVTGKRKPPLKHVERWTKALRGFVNPAEFRELAELEHAPDRVRRLVWRLRDELAETLRNPPSV